MSEASTHPCAVCEQPASTRCSQCKAVYYCSADHSRADWKSHKSQCKLLKSAESGDLTVTALLFPVNEDAPRLVKVKYTVERDEETETDKHVPDLTQWLWPQTQAVRQINSYGIFGRGEKLGRMLHMFFNEDYASDGSPVNHCVQTLTEGKAEKWGGNILVLRAREPTTKYTQYYNATMDDVAPMISFFKEYTALNLAKLGM